MSARDNLNQRQFRQPTMSVKAVGKLGSGDYGRPMGEVAPDHYARFEMDSRSKYADDAEFENLASDVAEHGVEKPLEIGRGGYDPAPAVKDGHHRFFAAWETGQPRVPVSGNVRAAKAFAHYTPYETGSGYVKSNRRGAY